MKTYDMEIQYEPYTGQHEGIAATESDDGEWVPADVAQGLYDALEAMVNDGGWHGGEWSPSDAAVDEAARALATADGEDV